MGHLLLGKSGKTIFCISKVDKNHTCRINLTGKPGSAGDGLVMKVPYRLFFITEEKYVNILQKKLSVLL